MLRTTVFVTMGHGRCIGDVASRLDRLSVTFSPRRGRGAVTIVAPKGEGKNAT